MSRTPFHLLGQHVVLSRVKQDRFRGMTGVVTRVYRTKNEAEITLDANGKKYHAFLGNFDPVPV